MKDYINTINEELILLKRRVKFDAAKAITKANSDLEIEKIKLAELYYESMLNRCRNISCEIFEAANEVNSMFDSVVSGEDGIVDLDDFNLDIHVEPVSKDFYGDKYALNFKKEKHNRDYKRYVDNKKNNTHYVSEATYETDDDYFKESKIIKPRFDIDELIRRIDAKIEELEKEQEEASIKEFVKEEKTINPFEGDFGFDVSKVNEVKLDTASIEEKKKKHEARRRAYLENLKKDSQRIVDEGIEFEDNPILNIEIKPISQDMTDIEISENPNFNFNVKKVNKVSNEDITLYSNPDININDSKNEEELPPIDFSNDETEDIELNGDLDLGVEIKPVSLDINDIEINDNPNLHVDVKNVSDANDSDDLF